MWVILFTCQGILFELPKEVGATNSYNIAWDLMKDNQTELLQEFKKCKIPFTWIEEQTGDELIYGKAVY